MQREHAVEHRLAVERADRVVVGPGLERAAAVLAVVGLEHDRHVRVAHPRVGAQPAAHLEAGEVLHDPVDERPGGPLDQLARPFGGEQVEGEHGVAVDEVLEPRGAGVRRQDADPVHPATAPSQFAACPAAGCDWHMTDRGANWARAGWRSAGGENLAKGTCRRARRWA